MMELFFVHATKAKAIEMCTKEWLPEERAAARFI
jgi:hypothetical protein